MIVKIPLKLAPETNLSQHWTKSSKRHRIQKLVVHQYLKQYKPPPPPWTIKLTRISPRKFDHRDNLRTAFKWITDACCEFLVPGLAAGRADDDPRITVEYYQVKGLPGEIGIQIEIVSDLKDDDITEKFVLEHQF